MPEIPEDDAQARALADAAAHYAASITSMIERVNAEATRIAALIGKAMRDLDAPGPVYPQPPAGVEVDPKTGDWIVGHTPHGEPVRYRPADVAHHHDDDHEFEPPELLIERLSAQINELQRDNGQLQRARSEAAQQLYQIEKRLDRLESEFGGFGEWQESVDERLAGSEPIVWEGPGGRTDTVATGVQPSLPWLGVGSRCVTPFGPGRVTAMFVTSGSPPRAVWYDVELSAGRTRRLPADAVWRPGQEPSLYVKQPVSTPDDYREWQAGREPPPPRNKPGEWKRGSIAAISVANYPEIRGQLRLAQGDPSGWASDGYVHVEVVEHPGESTHLMIVRRISQRGTLSSDGAPQAMVMTRHLQPPRLRIGAWVRHEVRDSAPRIGRVTGQRRELITYRDITGTDREALAVEVEVFG